MWGVFVGCCFKIKLPQDVKKTRLTLTLWIYSKYNMTTNWDTTSHKRVCLKLRAGNIQPDTHSLISRLADGEVTMSRSSFLCKMYNFCIIFCHFNNLSMFRRPTWQMTAIGLRCLEISQPDSRGIQILLTRTPCDPCRHKVRWDDGDSELSLCWKQSAEAHATETEQCSQIQENTLSKSNPVLLTIWCRVFGQSFFQQRENYFALPAFYSSKEIFRAISARNQKCFQRTRFMKKTCRAGFHHQDGSRHLRSSLPFYCLRPGNWS